MSSWEYYPERYIRNYGISCHTADVRDWISDRMYVAQCGSKQCAGVQNHTNGKMVTKRVLDISATFCPDCGLRLVWKNKPKH